MTKREKNEKFKCTPCQIKWNTPYQQKPTEHLNYENYEGKLWQGYVFRTAYTRFLFKSWTVLIPVHSCASELSCFHILSNSKV